MRALEAVIVGRQQRVAGTVLPFSRLEPVEQFLGLLLVQFEFGANSDSVAAVETVFGELLLLQQTNVAVRLVRGPAEIVDTLDALQESANALKAARVGAPTAS